jgi:hypothetical protein
MALEPGPSATSHSTMNLGKRRQRHEDRPWRGRRFSIR